MSDLPLTFTIPNFPADFSGSNEDYSKLFVRALNASVSNDSVIYGRIGGVAPLSNIGPWADGQSWKTWSTSLGKYQFNTFAVGNKDFVARVDGTPTANRTLLVQDKSGILATTDDLYIPRQTYPFYGGSAFVIDWNASNTFYVELNGDGTIFGMFNSRHGQKIYIAINNPSNYDIFFVNQIGFSGGVQPVQTKFIASSLTDVSTQNGNKLIISAMAAFIKADEGLTITTAGNTPIPAATTIATVMSPTHALLSNASIADTTNTTATIVSRPAIGRTDLWVFKNVGGSIYGRVIQGYPGLLRVAGAALSASAKAEVLPDPPAAPVQTIQPVAFDPQPGHENLTPGDMTIVMTVMDPAVAIRYTTDGTIPTATTGLLISSTSGSYTLTQGDQVEIAAIAVGADNSVSAYKRAKYSNVYTVPVVDTSPIIDNADTGQARLDKGAEGGLMPTKT